MNKKIKKLKNKDFKVIYEELNTSYNIPVVYDTHQLLSNAKRGKHCVCRNKRHKRT